MGVDTEALADLLAERDRLRADVRELVECLSDCRNEFATLPRSLGYEITHMRGLDALLAKHKEASNGK